MPRAFYTRYTHLRTKVPLSFCISLFSRNRVKKNKIERFLKEEKKEAKDNIKMGICEMIT